jgi:hypothetical protein
LKSFLPLLSHLTLIGLSPSVFSPPFLASPPAFCAALFLLTKLALPFLPNLSAAAELKHAA